MANPKPLNNESDYDTALARISDLMDALSGPEGQETDGNHPGRVELDSLVTKVEIYEDKHYPIDPPSAIEAIEFYIDQFGMSPENPIGPIRSQTRDSQGSSERWAWHSSSQPASGAVMRRVATSRVSISTAA